MKNILVTGAGALLGQGILRCLECSKKDYNLISADPDIRSTGHALANKSYRIPFATNPSFLNRIEEIIVSENIDLIFIGTDVELPTFAENKKYLENKYDLVVVVSYPRAVQISNNKWLTAKFLKENNFPYPQSALTTNMEEINALKNNSCFPFIAKPIDGARSKGIEILNDEKDFEKVCSYKNNLVVQELLGEEEGEFTTGCIVVNGKCAAVVSMTRDLRDGNTWRAFRGDESSRYDTTISAIAERLKVEGPANFQYRIRNGEPVVFEINCRFSGTTPLRMMFGFNEVEALTEYYLEDKPIEQPLLKKGTILRTFSDVFVPNESLQKFEEKGVTNSFRSQYYPFKNQFDK